MLRADVHSTSHIINQWQLLKVNPSRKFRSEKGAEVIPVKDSHTRIGIVRLLHNHCARTGTCVRIYMVVSYSRYKFFDRFTSGAAVSLLILKNGAFKLASGVDH